MKKIAIICFIFCCCKVSAIENIINLSVDGGLFFQDLNTTRWEMYYSFPDNFLKYIYQDSNYYSKLNFNIKIKNTGILKLEDQWVVTHQIKSMDSINKSILYGTKSFILFPGQYQIELNVYDENNPSVKAKTEFDINVDRFQTDKIQLSTLQLASLIVNSDSCEVKYDEMFKKFNLFVIPNPSLEINGEKSNLLAYSEIYNAHEIAPDGYKINYRIYDASKQQIYFLETVRESNSDISPDGVNITLSNFPTGVYFLKQTVCFPITKPEDSISTIKKFFLINSKVPPISKKYFTENELFAKSIFSTLDDKGTEDELKKASIIATDEEIYQMNKLGTKEAKQRYLFVFWRMKDTDTNTVINERYEEFSKAIQFSNMYFKTSFKQGWDTDRGKVMLKYGFPTERKIHDEIAGNNPYEEWFFQNVQGGVFFYFVDRTRLNNFVLYHSTAKSEPYYPDWFNDFVPTTSNKGIEDNRYFNDNDYRK